MDFVGTIISVLFNYTGPFFLRGILSLIDGDPTPEARTKAYIYAVLAFICGVLKAQVDLQRLWFSRRAAARVRVELMASVYEKVS